MLNQHSTICLPNFPETQCSFLMTVLPLGMISHRHEGVLTCTLVRRVKNPPVIRPSG
jgi:hypothetical protein